MKREILQMQEAVAGVRETVGLDQFHFYIKEGETVGLLGASGSGKTVLYEYLNGTIPLTAGRVLFEGKTCSPGEKFPFVESVICLGRNSTLIPGLSIAENIFVINRKRRFYEPVWMPGIMYRARIMLSRYAPYMSPETKVEQLSEADRRIVELLRAIENEVKLVYIDNAFQGFGIWEKKRLLDLLDVLKDKNTSVIYASHDAEAYGTHADRLIVLRRGRNIRTFYEKDYSEDYCRRLLFGDVKLPKRRKQLYSTPKEVIGVRRSAQKTGAEKEADTAGATVLSFHEGEVVGLYDMNNRNNLGLLKILLGEEENPGLEIRLEGKIYRPKNSWDAIRNGIGYLLRDFSDLPLVPELNVGENLSLPVLSHNEVRFFLHGKKIARILEKEQGDALGIPEELRKERVRNLDYYARISVYLKRWELFCPKIMLCMEPFANGDIFMKDIILKTLEELAKRGTTILIASQNMNDLRNICEKIYIMNNTEHMEIYSVMREDKV
ncbi:MAG: sugar ABC transporter ATP-binding protein [Blautia sp.]|nr:sugar ABC transporter ATP-binding protein [Blautia sp.]